MTLESTPHDDAVVPNAEPRALGVAGRMASATMLLAIFALLLPISGTVMTMFRPSGRLVDFAQEWTSARNFLSGRPVYMDINKSIALNFGVTSSRFPVGAVNAHPPASVLLALPFARLDYPQALVAWTGVSLAALALSLLLIARQPGMGSGWLSLVPISAVVMAGNPFDRQVYHGQLTLVLLLLITGSWVAVKTGHSRWAAVQIALAAALKVFPAFLFLYFLVRREWRELLVGLGALAVIAGSAVAVLGFGNVLAYATVSLPSTQGYSDHWLNASLAGFWSKLFHAPSGHVAPLWFSPATERVLTLVSVGVVVAMIARSIRAARSEADRDRSFALAVIGMLLVSPLTWDHSFLLLILPIAVLWRTSAPTAFNRIFLLGVIALLSCNPVPFWGAHIVGQGEWAAGAARSVAQPWQTLSVLSYPLYTLLGLFGFATFAA